jgi:ABC-type phosphate/phosphonate transport system substrate-binding protein
MYGHTGRGCALLLALAGLVGILVPASGAERTDSAEGVRIGMVKTLFRDLPESAAMAMMRPFGALMHAQTGVQGQLVPGGDAEALGRQLAEDKLQLGIFHGIEFAWARQKFPELRPLMIAINQERHLRAFLVVRADQSITGFADLKGKVVALPRGTRQHCHVYLKHHCQQCGGDMQEYFTKVTVPANCEEALDDVVDGVVQATVADTFVIDCYKRRKPGRFAKLKLLEQSEVFPAAVIAYKPGTLDDATLGRFRHGLVNASRNAGGRQLLTLWKLTAFEPVPDDYEQTLADSAKAYPCPAGETK